MNRRDWNVTLLGMLAEDEEVYNETGKPFSVFVNKQNIVQFMIRLVSHPPSQFPPVKLFTVFASELIPYGFEDPTHLSEGDRVEALRSFLEESFLLFRPFYKKMADQTEFYQGKDIRLCPIPEDYRRETFFVSLPLYGESVHGYTFEEFKERLANHRFVGRIPGLSTETGDGPGLVLWEHKDGSYQIFGVFTGQHHAHGGFSYQFHGKIHTMAFPFMEMDSTCKGGDSLLFIPEGLNRRLQDQVQTADPVKARKVPLPSEQRGDGKKDESHFVDHFVNLTVRNGMVYAPRDLVNFHTAMKTSKLNILAGMSGTGKSRLVQLYGKALGMDEERLILIPVRPSWTDDADLIGYMDDYHGIFRPGSSGLIDALIRAEKNQNKSYLICFDEMNLARVEHYFSQFLSILEMESQSRRIRLYNDGLKPKNADFYPPVVTVGDNVMFVGTVNMDESTHPFSDKVLDRANVITLEIMPFMKMKEVAELHLNGDEVSFLWELHGALQGADHRLGFGPRVIRQMELYLDHVPVNPYLSRKEAFDLQVIQRIFPKLRGAEGRLGTLIQKTIPSILDRYSMVSEFNETRKALINKGKELKQNGYAL